MVAYPIFAPKWIAEGGIIGPKTRQLFPAEQASWKDGDPVANVVTGAVITPTGGAGNLATAAGPSLGAFPSPFNVNSVAYSVTQGVVTVTATANTAAPARTLFVAVTYTGGTQANESLLSVPFIINVPAGLNAIVSVSATGEPANATDFALYAGFLPATYYLQNNAATATGGTATLVWPLANSAGVNKAPAGTVTGILGIADSDSDAYFAGVLGATAGGSINTGKRSLFGATQSFQPGWTNDAFALPVTDLHFGELELSLKQGWYLSLTQSLVAVGFSFDATTGYIVADTTQAPCMVVQDTAFGAGLNTAYAPNSGDTGARIRVKFNTSALS